MLQINLNYCDVLFKFTALAYTVQNNSYSEKQSWNQVNGLYGALPAYMRSGPALRGSSAMRSQETSGMNHGGNTANRG